jgi:hypothetical protein
MDAKWINLIFIIIQIIYTIIYVMLDDNDEYQTELNCAIISNILIIIIFCKLFWW